MAQYGLVPSDITSVLGEQNIEAPTGSLGESSDNVFQYTMKYKGRLKEVEEFENMVIRSQSDGSVLRVKDVADVELGRQSYIFMVKQTVCLVLRLWYSKWLEQTPLP